MKKLLFAAGMLMAFAACQKDNSPGMEVSSASSFTVSIPQGGTRAVSDAFGTGTSANRCILEIYRDGRLYDRIEKGVTAKTVTFDNLRLVAQQSYDFVFWADCADGSEGNFTDRHYNTQSLKAISNLGDFEGNSDERDAFFAHESFEVTGSFSKPVILTRPFGLLAVKTNDLNAIKDEALKPTGYTVAFKNMPDTFNALTGEVSGSTDIAYTADDLAKAADGTISMDFLWATDAEAALSDFTMTFLHDGIAICTNDAFTNIPIRRNYKTNVSGNLLTKQGTIAVTIDPEFGNPDYDVTITEVATAEEAQEAIAQGGNVSVVAPIELIDLSSSTPAEELNLVLNAAVGTLRLGTQEEAPLKTTVTVAKDVPYPAFTVARNSKIRNLEIVGDPTSSESCTSGITAYGLNVPVIDGVTIRGVRFKGEGVNFAYTANPQRVTDILVEDCVGEEMLKPFFQTSRNPYDGCEMGDIVIRNNTIAFSAEADKSSVNGIYICLTTQGSVLIENNTLVDAPYHGITGNENRCDQFVIRGNTITKPEQDGIKFDYPDNELLIEDNTIAPTEYGIRVARFKADYTPAVTIKNNRIDMSSAKSSSYTGVYIGYILGDKASPMLFVNRNVKAGGAPNNWFYLVSAKITPAEGSDIETPFID